MAHMFEISNVVTNVADICLRQFRIKFNHSNLVFFGVQLVIVVLLFFVS